jgi:hypothetical protein
MKNPQEEITSERDHQYFISFALDMEVLFSKNNVLFQPSILLVFSAGDIPLPSASSRNRFIHRAPHT